MTNDHQKNVLSSICNGGYTYLLQVPPKHKKLPANAMTKAN